MTLRPPTPTPRVRVGNILGTRRPEHEVAGVAPFEDTTSREVEIAPETSYLGETHDYIVTFTAPGPMYGHVLVVTLPDIRPADNTSGSELALPTDKTVADQISVRAPGALIDFDAAANIDGNNVVTIGLTRINKDQKVTITLRDAEVVTTSETSSVTLTAFVVTTNTTNPVTKITGGAFALAAGSGELTVSPDSAKAGAVLRRITVTYEAVTVLKDATLEITVPAGIMASKATAPAGEGDDATFYLQPESGKTGYVYSPDKKGTIALMVAEDPDATLELPLSHGQI